MHGSSEPTGDYGRTPTPSDEDATANVEAEVFSFLIRADLADAVADQLRSAITSAANVIEHGADDSTAFLVPQVEEMTTALRALRVIESREPDAPVSIPMPPAFAKELAGQMFAYARDLVISSEVGDPQMGYAKMTAGSQIEYDLCWLADQREHNNRIAKFRRCSRWSRAEMAAKLGVPKASVRGWEKNREHVPYDAMMTMVRLFGLNGDHGWRYMMGREGER